LGYIYDIIKDKVKEKANFDLDDNVKKNNNSNNFYNE